MDIVLLTPARRFIANRYGLGYQLPLGLVLIGGPLIDAGHRVRLIDNDALGWSDARLISHLSSAPPDCIMIGHASPTAAHPVAMRTARSLKDAFPEAVIVYGGVYPSYTAKTVLSENRILDVIVHGEGEATVVDLVAALEKDRASLDSVAGITWRRDQDIVGNPRRAPIADLDAYRPGWDLVDWSHYKLFGFGRAAGMQFSRGCTLTCTYCGQWSFWSKWRYRSPEFLADQLEILAKRYGVRIVWLADENFAADREVTRKVLECIASRNLGLSLNLNMTAADVVRDADLLPLYKRAGVDNIIMGVESLEDETVDRVRKNNPFAISCEAARLLRQHGIVGLMNIIYGLERDTLKTLWRTFRRILVLDPDILNAVYITPHHWTREGRSTRSEQIIQADQQYWTYRNQVVATPGLSPWKLFLAIKTTEALLHLRPRALWRMMTGPDARYCKILRSYLWIGIKVWLAEIYEFIVKVRFARAGSLPRIPGFPPRHPKPR
jgi:anaerobic magnesium-protoporphyrin IX monomethyl ester cyclase